MFQYWKWWNTIKSRNKILLLQFMKIYWNIKHIRIYREKETPSQIPWQHFNLTNETSRYMRWNIKYLRKKNPDLPLTPLRWLPPHRHRDDAMRVATEMTPWLKKYATIATTCFCGCSTTLSPTPRGAELGHVCMAVASQSLATPLPPPPPWLCSSANPWVMSCLWMPVHCLLTEKRKGAERERVRDERMDKKWWRKHPIFYLPIGCLMGVFSKKLEKPNFIYCLKRKRL